MIYPLRDGYGNSEIMGVFRADPPEQVGQFYGIGIENSPPGVLERVSLLVGKRADEKIVVSVVDHTGTLLAGDLVTPSSNGFIILKLFIDDVLNRVYASYSIDNGITYKNDTQFGYFYQHGTAFTATPWMYSNAQGWVRF
jgi:hypothetical protein